MTNTLTPGFNDELSRSRVQDISIVVPSLEMDGTKSQVPVPASPEISAFIKGHPDLYRKIDPTTGHISYKDFEKGVTNHMVDILNDAQNLAHGTTGNQFAADSLMAVNRWKYDPNQRVMEQQHLLDQVTSNFIGASSEVQKSSTAQVESMASRMQEISPAFDFIVNENVTNMALKDRLPSPPDGIAPPSPNHP